MQKDVESHPRRFVPRLDSQVQVFGDQRPAIFWSTDARLRITWALGEGLALLHREPAELVGASLPDLFQRQEPDRQFVEAHRRALEGHSASFRTVWNNRAFDVHVGPYRSSKGKILGVIGAALEITGRKREASTTDASEWRFRALIENSSDMIALVGADGMILYASPSTSRILGYSLDEFVGRDAFELIHPDDLERIRKVLADLVRMPGGTTVAEYRLRARDGSWRWIEGSGTNLLAKPSVQAIVVNYRDISERKRAEEALRQTEEKYRSIVENAVEGFFQTTPEGGYVSVNPALARMYGYDSPEQLMASVSDIGHEIYVDPGRRAEFKRLMEEHGVVREFEYQVYRRDRKKIWLSESARTVRDAEGTIRFYEGTVEDITERKRAETERQVMFEIIHGFSVTPNLDELLRLIHQALKKVLYAENCFVALYNRTAGMFHFPFFVDQFDTPPPPQKVGRSCTAYVFRMGRPMLIQQKRFDQLAEQGEVELVGTPSPTWLGVPLRTPSETIGVLVVQHYGDENAYTDRDLEFLAWVGGQIALAIQRKQVEDTLRKQQEEQQIIFNSAPYMIWYKDKENRILRANKAAADSLDLKVSELEGRSVYDLFPEEAEKYHQDDLEVIRTEKTKLGIVEPYQMASSQKRWVRTDKIPYRDLDGNIIGVIVFATDITEGQRAEEALRRSEANYRSLVQGAPYGIYRVTADGKLLGVNSALVEMLGYSSEQELLSVNMNRSVYRDSPERVRLLEQGSGQLQGLEVEWVRKDGTPITVRLSGRPVRDESGREVSHERIAENVTERRALERQLRQAQKMEAVGRLAGGVAHDFNNLLMVIKGHTELLLERGCVDDWQQRKVEQIQKSADKAAGLTRQLLAFSRMQVLQPKVMDLNAVVIEMGKLLPPLIGEDIELAILTDPRLGHMKADPGQIEQVILNLAVNARDAMPSGGKLLIETQNADLDEAYARRHPPLVPGGYVMLAVSDTGVGMDAETQAHVFEPFFTTKEKGRGTGLGLATVYGVVKQSGGYIWLYSEPGQGTTFKIYLPRVGEVSEAACPGRVSTEAPLGSETILLAEDERDVREVAREFLILCGYTVLEAKDGAEAIEIATKHAGPIHLLLTDMVMPGMGGRELAARLAPMRSDMKVIYMSGYTEYARTHHGEVEPNVALLTKPFTRSSLARTVREVLHRGKVN
jgi:two-component system, cell cycle sensor histidine kinase and response regulator CckA